MLVDVVFRFWCFLEMIKIVFSLIFNSKNVVIKVWNVCFWSRYGCYFLWLCILLWLVYFIVGWVMLFDIGFVVFCGSVWESLKVGFFGVKFLMLKFWMWFIMIFWFVVFVVGRIWFLFGVVWVMFIFGNLCLNMCRWIVLFRRDWLLGIVIFKLYLNCDMSSFFFEWCGMGYR